MKNTTLGKSVFVILLSIIFSPFSVAQQSTNGLIGQVINKQKEKLLGNALLLSSIDSSLIKGALFMNGNFEFESINKSELLLKIVSFGYRDTIIALRFPANGNQYDLGTIALSTISKELNVVNVTASVPLFETTDFGSLKVNVGNTLLSSSTTVMELLSKSPTVIVEDNVVTVLGKGIALIYLNGKRISENQLSSIQVSQIKNIEIISSPSAKYDANGKAVINIVTVKSPYEGLLGEVVQNTTYAKHPLSFTSLDVNWRKRKWSVSLNYGQDLGSEWSLSHMKREITTPSGKSESINDFDENPKTKYGSNYLFGVEYDIDSTSSLTVEYIGATSITDQNSASTTLFSDYSNNLTTITANISGESRNVCNAANINYNKKLDTLGSNLFIGGQHLIFSSSNKFNTDESIQNNSLNSHALRMNKLGSEITFSTAQTDVETFLKNGSKFGYGIKYTNAGNTGKVDFYSKTEGSTDYVFFPGLSTDFNYQENIPAAYIQYFGNVKSKCNYSLGIRSEYTSAKGVSKSVSQTIIDTTYINIFPNFSINYKISDDLKLNLGFSSNINRPSYQALDPFLFYVDSLTASQGNPDLKPEYAYATELNVSYKRYSFKMGYTLTLDAFRYAMLPGTNGENSSLLKQINIQKQNSYFASINAPLEYKSFQSNNVAGITLDQIMDNRQDYKTSGSIPRVYLYTNNNLMIKKVGRLELNCRYLGTRFDGIYYRKPAYSVSMGISRKFFENKLKCTFLADDIFSSNVVDGYYQIGTSKVSYVRNLNSHFYRLTLTYKFGGLREVNYNSVNVGDESGNRIRK